jgi:hypothetical protein
MRTMLNFMGEAAQREAIASARNQLAVAASAIMAVA